MSSPAIPRISPLGASVSDLSLEDLDAQLATLGAQYISKKNWTETVNNLNVILTMMAGAVQPIDPVRQALQNQAVLQNQELGVRNVHEARFMALLPLCMETQTQLDRTDTAWSAIMLAFAAECQRQLGQKPKALELARQALELADKVDEPRFDALEQLVTHCQRIVSGMPISIPLQVIDDLVELLPVV